MILAILIAVAQLSDAYLRQLAFASKISYEVKRRLWFESAAWCMASIALYILIFKTTDIGAATYKTILMLGWLPYFLICMRLIPWGVPQHVFVLGMGTICSLLQHSVGAIIILLTLPGLSDAEIILLDATFYLLLFALFLPILSRYFVKLLPSREFFDLRPQGIYIAILPLVIISGHLILIADDVLVHSWAERLSRFYMPLLFLFFYRYILLTADNFYALQKLEQSKVKLEEQLNGLKEFNEHIRENQRRVSVIRHDLRHSYNLIYAMLESGNIDKAREHIITQKFLLEAAKVQTFCQLPLINAALTICLTRVEELGVQVFHKINLPPTLDTDERDFAILLSNVLERIVISTTRKLSVIIQHVDGQCVLEISVRGSNIKLSEEPIKIFAAKYDAYSNLTHDEDGANLLMYWRDGGK